MPKKRMWGGRREMGAQQPVRATHGSPLPRWSPIPRPSSPVLNGLLALILSIALPTWAKSANDYYHGSAYRYVEGKIQEAAAEVEEGLRAYPGDAKLRALAEQIRKMQDQQRGNSGGNGNPNDPKDRDKGSQKNNPDEKNSGKQDPKGDGNPGDKPDEGKQPPGSGENPDRPDQGNGGKDRPQPGKMSEQEAERLLNSFADDEKKEQAERRRILRTRPGTEQDW